MDEQAVGYPAAISLLVIGAALAWYGRSHEVDRMTSMGIFLLVAGVLCSIVVAIRERR